MDRGYTKPMARGTSLTPDQQQTIIEHRLNGVPVATVIQLTGHARQTVINVYRDYLAATADERREEVEQVRAGLVDRHERAAFTARIEGEAAKQNGDTAAHARYLREERDSLREVARLTGADLPVKVEVSGTVDVNVADPRERLAEYLLSLCPSSN